MRVHCMSKQMKMLVVCTNVRGEEVPVRGCGPAGPRADEQELSTYSGAPCNHQDRSSHGARTGGVEA